MLLKYQSEHFRMLVLSQLRYQSQQLNLFLPTEQPISHLIRRTIILDIIRSKMAAAAVDTPRPFYTTSNGRPITNPESSQRLGLNGPLLLQDFHLIDLLAHFDRERIPERVVHAKGGGAFGEFEVTDDIADVVCYTSFSFSSSC